MESDFEAALKPGRTPCSLPSNIRMFSTCGLEGSSISCTCVSSKSKPTEIKEPEIPSGKTLKMLIDVTVTKEKKLFFMIQNY